MKVRNEVSAQAVRPKTMRLEPLNEAGLAMLKEATGVPVNKMVNEAVSEYVQRKSVALEARLSTALERVKAYRRADPAFTKDLEAFVRSEAKHGAKDPLEGVPFELAPRAATRKLKPRAGSDAKAGSALARVRDITRS